VENSEPWQVEPAPSVQMYSAFEWKRVSWP
jgi:hypothetical protein